MQSLSARRRVESGWNGDEGFRVPLELGGRCDVVRGGYGGVRAEFEHGNAQEEAGGGVVEELFCEGLDFGEEFGGQDGGASCGGAWDGGPRDFEEDQIQDEGAAEAPGGGSDGGEPQAACGVCGECAAAADGAAAGDDTQRGGV